MVDAISSLTGTTASSTTASAAAATTLNTDYKSFLTLLTAQLTNQDPLEPMDSSTFVTQLAQLSQVEQAIQTNTNLETIATQLSTAGLSGDLGLIGHEVSVPGEQFDLVNGSATFDYALETGASEAYAVITNSAGEIVAQISNLDPEGGMLHSVEWSGVGADGSLLDDGIYNAEIIATDADGEVVTASAYTRSIVQGLSLENGESLLRLANGSTAYASLVAGVNVVN